MLTCLAVWRSSLPRRTSGSLPSSHRSWVRRFSCSGKDINSVDGNNSFQALRNICLDRSNSSVTISTNIYRRFLLGDSSGGSVEVDYSTNNSSCGISTEDNTCSNSSFGVSTKDKTSSNSSCGPFTKNKTICNSSCGGSIKDSRSSCGTTARNSISSNSSCGTMMEDSTGLLLGMGNPLLDITAKVEPELLQRYNLKPNNAVLTTQEDIFTELVSQYKVEYSPGGATQNSIRVAQWILGRPANTTYFGCVGRDETSRIMEEKARAAGVNVRYQYSHVHPTGRCAVLITDDNRSLVTKLDAAAYYSSEHLDDPDNWRLVEKAKAVYSGGYFLTVSPESMLKVSKYCAKNKKTYCINLSAPFLCHKYKKELDMILPYTDILFGNDQEAKAFAQAQGYESTELKEIAKRIAAIPKQDTTSSSTRVVIITQGTAPIICVRGGEVTEHPVPLVPREKLVDTNGAGDAFVGGFLAQLVQDRSFDVCLRCGMYASSEIVQRSGCSVPETMTFVP